MEAEAMEEMELEPAVQEHANTSHSEDWRKALSRVVPAVVVLRTTATRTFDTEVAGSGYATGFVVDKRRGILLTNRHVIEPGPIVAEAVFVNRDEIPVYPLYRDPIHDFGFLRFDPAQFSEYEEIPLAPAAAVVGLEIRVVGNDSGGKVSILAGTLARLDRDAPFYKKYGYNDFNTFYIQAASGTKGGSSGSPVIDIHGRAVALNAGGHKSSSALAYYLPLERVVRALHLLQAQKDELSLKPGWAPPVIPRGTFQMTLSHIGFDEIRRLGLKRATEKMVRRVSPSSETGMLVVESVVPGGPAFENQLEPGDVLVRAGGEVLTQFLKYESLLDDNVGSPVSLEFERRGTPMTVTITVQDLHSITPNKFLEVSGGVIHALSYQQARNFHVPCGLVYVAKPGYMFSRAGVPKHAIIKNIAGEETVDIAAFISVFFKFAKGARVPLEFVSHVDKHRRKSVFVTIDRHEWYAPPQIYTRNDATGLWDIQLVERTPLNAQPMELADGKVLSGKSKWKKMLQSSILKVTETFERVSSVVAERAIKPCLVMIDVHIPKSAWLDGVHASLFSGTGVIVHHSKDLGLVAIDKYTAAISASDVVLSFAAFPIEIPGQIVFSHPVHNYAFVAYNPTALGKVGIKEVHAAILSPNPPLPRGYTVNLVGLSRTMGAKSRRSTVTNPSAHLTVASALRYYRSMNTEVIELGTDLGHAYSGVLADRNGNVRALWSSFSTQGTNGEDCRCMRGIPIHAICKVLDAVVNALGPSLVMQKSMPVMRILEVEFDPTLLSKARSFGLTDKWIHVLGEKDSTRRQVLRVKGCLAGSRAHGVLNEGDMLLAISGKPVTCFRDVEIACGDSETLDLRLFRQGREINIEVGLDERDGFGTTHMLSWAGCVLQEPHSAVRALGFLPPQGRGVYMGRWCRGSPSQRYGLNALKWIVEVNGKPTPNLEDFVDVARELEHDAFVHVKMLHLNGKPKVLTMKQDLHYWPTWELRLNPTTALWSRHVIKAH